MFESTDGWKNCRVKIDRIRRASPHAEHIKSHYEAVCPSVMQVSTTLAWNYACYTQTFV